MANVPDTNTVEKLLDARNDLVYNTPEYENNGHDCVEGGCPCCCWECRREELMYNDGSYEQWVEESLQNGSRHA